MNFKGYIKALGLYLRRSDSKILTPFTKSLGIWPLFDRLWVWTWTINLSYVGPYLNSLLQGLPDLPSTTYTVKFNTLGLLPRLLLLSPGAPRLADIAAFVFKPAVRLISYWPLRTRLVKHKNRGMRKLNPTFMLHQLCSISPTGESMKLVNLTYSTKLSLLHRFDPNLNAPAPARVSPSYALMGLWTQTPYSRFFNVMADSFILSRARHLFKKPSSEFEIRPNLRTLTGYYSETVTSLLNAHLSYFLGTPSSLFLNFKFSDSLSRLDLGIVTSIKLRLRHLSSTFSNIIFIPEFLDILYFTLLARDLVGLKTYVRKTFSKLSIWDHKRFTTLLFNMFSHQLYPIFERLGILGFYIRIKGKLGVGGNSRKRSASASMGEISTSNYPSTASFLNSTITTPTGVLGLQILIVSKC